MPRELPDYDVCGCGGRGYVHCTYGAADPPACWIPVQRCDLCRAPETVAPGVTPWDDEDAAYAFAADVGGYVSYFDAHPDAAYDDDLRAYSDEPGDWFVTVG